MTRAIRVEADLRFVVDAGAPDGPVHGTVRADGTHVAVTADKLEQLAGGAGVRTLRRLALAAARQGLTIGLGGPDGPAVTVGAVRSRLLHRALTGSRYVRVDSWRQAWRLRRGGAAAGATDGTRPSRAVLALPPSTPWPPAPTFRRGRRTVTTTHDPRGGGRPQLVFALGPAPRPGERQRVHLLRPGITTIGSDPLSDLRLDGIAPRQAEVRRDEDDEYVLVDLDDATPTRVNGEPGGRHVLRTGTRIEMGPWTMSYWREEYADHGRPYGGRSGGELSHQRPQPVPSYRPPKAGPARRPRA